MVQRVLAVIFFIFITSCNRSSSNAATVQNLKLLDTVIDYTSVDVYPLFTDYCDEAEDKQARKACFETTLTDLLAKKLHKFDYKVKEDVNDSTYVDLLINQNGKTKVVAINSPQIIKENLPQLDSLIRESVDQLPIIKAALKEGRIPVKSQYKLAVVVRTR